MDPRSELMVRFLLSLIVGVAVVAIAMILAQHGAVSYDYAITH
jgi:hypothetical protein